MMYCEDYDFYLLALSEGKQMTNLSKVLVKYRIVRNSISRSKAILQCLFSEKAKFFYQQRIKNGTNRLNRTRSYLCGWRRH